MDVYKRLKIVLCKLCKYRFIYLELYVFFILYFIILMQFDIPLNFPH